MLGGDGRPKLLASQSLRHSLGSGRQRHLFAQAVDGVARALPNLFLDLSALGSCPSRQAGPPNVSLRVAPPVL